MSVYVFLCLCFCESVCVCGEMCAEFVCMFLCAYVFVCMCVRVSGTVPVCWLACVCMSVGMFVFVKAPVYRRHLCAKMFLCKCVSVQTKFWKETGLQVRGYTCRSVRAQKCSCVKGLSANSSAFGVMCGDQMVFYGPSCYESKSLHKLIIEILELAFLPLADSGHKFISNNW